MDEMIKEAIGEAAAFLKGMQAGVLHLSRLII